MNLEPPQSRNSGRAVLVCLLVVCLGAVMLWLVNYPEFWLRTRNPDFQTSTKHIEKQKPFSPVAPSKDAGETEERAVELVDAQPGMCEISGRITLNGTPPAERELPLDSECRQLSTNKPSTRFYVVDSEGGLADVFVYIKNGLQAVTHSPPPNPVVLDQVECQYVPYVMGIQVGQKLLVRNSDPVIHNVHCVTAMAGNKSGSFIQLPASDDLEFMFLHQEIFVQFRCDVHYWMFAYVAVVSHPFFTVSGADGSFKIKNMPIGNYIVEARHRKAGNLTKQVTTMIGKPATVSFTFDVP